MAIGPQPNYPTEAEVAAATPEQLAHWWRTLSTVPPADPAQAEEHQRISMLIGERYQGGYR